MNPYNFIPIPMSEPDRQSGIPHNRFIGYSGEFYVTLTSISPMIICSGKGLTSNIPTNEPIQGIRNGEKHYFIPGTSLKGMLRNIYEIIVGGCLRLTEGGNLKTTHERAYGGCERVDFMCPACRVFGMLNKQDVYRGNVSPGDLIGPVVKVRSGAEEIKITVGRPKPEHEAFYRKGVILRGRKAYYHQEKPSCGTLQTKGVYPLPPGTAFKGMVGFSNLTMREVAILYYTLALENGLAHKIGFGKASGLGSAVIVVDSMQLADMGKRKGLEVNWLNKLPDECETILEDLKARTDGTWQAFKIIYSINDIKGKRYSYPSFKWFQDNPQRSLEEFNKDSVS